MLNEKQYHVVGVQSGVSSKSGQRYMFLHCEFEQKNIQGVGVESFFLGQNVIPDFEITVGDYVMFSFPRNSNYPNGVEIV